MSGKNPSQSLNINNTKPTMIRFSLQSLLLMSRWRLLLAALCLTMAIQLVYILGTPILYKIIFDDGIRDKNWVVLSQAVLALAGALLLFAIAGVVQEFVAARLGSRAISTLRRQLFLKLQEMPVRKLSQFGDGEIANRFGGDLSSVEIAIIRSLPVAMTQIVVVVLSLAMLFWIEWRLAILAVLTLPLIGFASASFNQRSNDAKEIQGRDETKLVEVAQESFAAHLIVRVFGLKPQLLARFNELLLSCSGSSAKAHMYRGLIGWTAVVSSRFMQLIVIGVGGYLSFHDYMTTGFLIAFIGLLFNVGGAVNSLTTAAPILAQASSGMANINKILEDDVASEKAERDITLEPLEKGIELKGVSFSYDGQNDVLSNVNLSIEAGKKVALVGPSGCGKTTVLSLLMGFYPPTSGLLTYDDRDMTDIDERALWRNMSAVLQAPSLFNTTIRENILMARPDAGEEDMKRSARSAAVLETITALPDGFETSVGSDGSNLSSGQRQRITIARALLKNSGILLFDEATSALDPKSEEQVNQSILDLPHGVTVVAATHRLASVIEFDKIFVFEDGRVEGSGSHDELLKTSRLYQELWSKQNGFLVDAEQYTAAVSAERLRMVPFLSLCDLETLEEFARYFSVERFVEERMIFNKGDFGDKFYMIAFGEVEVFVPRPDGREVSLGVLHKGDIFGEIALVEHRPRTASVRTVTETWCLTLPRQHFSRLVEDNPKFGSRIRRTIIERLASNEETFFPTNFPGA